MEMNNEFDLIVIGSGPAGEKAAVKAAYFNYRVAIIERDKRFGGAGIQTGTLPSKTLKETTLYLSGVYSKGIFGVDKELSRQAGIQDFMYRKNLVTHQAGNSVEANLRQHRVEIFKGHGEFLNAHQVRVTGHDREKILYGKYIIIATGSYPVHPSGIPFDGVRLHDSDSILSITRFPKSLCVLGAGVIGCEYATIFAAMGIKTYIVNNNNRILNFLDEEVSAALVAQMEKNGINVLFDNAITHFEVPANPEDDLLLTLKNGEVLAVDMFLFAAGRSGNTHNLKCENAGVQLDVRETVKVNHKFQTNVENIYAVGDVIGFPALASTSMDQGRIAVAHIFSTGDLKTLTHIFPYGIYTVPEVSMVGITEQQAKKENIDYNTGICHYRDTIRGKIMGDLDNGFLKLVFDKNSKQILGVHIIGIIATEIIHFGLALVKEKKTLDEVISTVFNFPTFHDLYKYAAYDGLGNLSGWKLRKPGEVIEAGHDQNV
ncbi:MAG TPA: Si-specific NAD(P)(+) transhydrogenase [Ohtaekwangia sp.]|uniref:Si-specific NAD(P)(+) transhydrogenase n=1 Tax=Ohtaekwangia sp. TaxID=2066019 RepID=UPI002F95B0EF